MEVKVAEIDFYNFKPLYTLQPVKLTREKQLRQWNEIVIRHCKENDIRTINPYSFSLFENVNIDRKLSIEGIAAVIDHMIIRGTAEWEVDKVHKVLRIILKPPEVLANEIYQYATKNDLFGSVSTIYELYAGEDEDTGFYGTDAVLIRRALVVLESLGKCKILNGKTAEEDGVKFLAVTE